MFYLHIYLSIIKKVLNNIEIKFASDSKFQGERNNMKPPAQITEYNIQYSEAKPIHDRFPKEERNTAH